MCLRKPEGYTDRGGRREEAASALKDTPIWAFHAPNDVILPVAICVEINQCVGCTIQNAP